MAIALEGNKDQAINPEEFTYAFVTKSGYEIKSYCDDSHAPFYYVSHEYGIAMIIQARNESDAWEAYLDNSKPIESSELWEAYGFDSEDSYKAAAEDLENDTRPELGEAYHYMPNSSGTTGIINVGHYTSHPALLTLEVMNHLGITMIIKLEVLK